MPDSLSGHSIQELTDSRASFAGTYCRQAISEGMRMDEVEGSIFDGDTVVVADTTVLLDVPDASTGSSDGTGWHAHVALPLGLVVEPGQQMRLETADGRSGPVALLDAPTTEGDRVLHVLTGLGPLVR